ncbi:hypothetical protein F5Y19DRAFT_312202 [Xylariaceae sp. FL1651]|nr:hypothetical protein F5Y19DRAFT_312202 [Xylariaceae sp. FL1651]
MTMSFPTSFPLFTLLPTELRLQIWLLSCQPRVVEVSYNPVNDCCTTTASIPPVLHTCHQSRSEALRVYKKSFGTKSHKSRIYFCREIDTLYIPRPPFMGYDDSSRSFTHFVEDTDDVLNLAIDHVQPSIRRPWETYNKYVLMQSFPKVQEVYLVTNTTFPADNSCHAGEFDLMDPAGDVLGLCRLLEDVKASFSYEVGGQFGMVDKSTSSTEPPSLPPLVLKSKVWTHHQDETDMASTICAA